MTAFVATMSIVSGCATSTGGDFCSIYRPVHPDFERDTPETIEQVLQNLAPYEELCA